MPSQSIVVARSVSADDGRRSRGDPGVERVQMVRDARIVFRKTPVMVVAVEVDEHRARPRGAAGGGRRRRHVPPHGRRRGLMVSDNLAQLQRLKLGEMLEVPAPNGSSGCRSSASSSTTRISRARS
jgi:hypothetical protein